MQRKGKRHREEEHEQHLAHDESNWLVSYADMMTLLFGFFVLMYSLGKVDKDKFEIVRRDLVKYFGGTLVENPGALNLKKKIENTLVQFTGKEGEENKLVSFEISANQLKIAFQSQLLFQSGQAELTRESAEIIDKVSQELKKFPTEFIEVEGHTDAEPIRSFMFPSNWELSSARSARIVRRIIENGFLKDKLVAKGYGDSQPKFPHFNNEGKLIDENKVKNRRVVLVVQLGDVKKEELQALQKQGFREVAAVKGHNSGVTTLDPAEEEAKANEKGAEDLKKKLFEAQVRYQEATLKLKSVQELEKSIKEMEALTRKTDEVERKIQSVEKKTEETMTRAQKVMQDNGDAQAQPSTPAK